MTNKEEYEARRAEELRVKNENVSRLTLLINDVATLIDPGCTVSRTSNEDSLKLATGDGFEFFIRWDSCGRDAYSKLEVSGSYHTEKLWEHRRLPMPQINVSASRSPEAIAKDIQRRFLEPYKAFITELRERKRRHEERQNARVTAASRLAESGGGIFKQVEDEEYHRGPKFKTDKLTSVYDTDRNFSGIVTLMVGDDVKMDLACMPFDLAQRLMLEIARYFRGDYPFGHCDTCGEPCSEPGRCLLDEEHKA